MISRAILLAVGLAAASGVPGLFMSRTGKAGQRVATALNLLSSVLGFSAAAWAAWSREPMAPLVFHWPLLGGLFAMGVDGLSALFLLPIFLISGLGALYGQGYWPQREHPDNGRKLRLFYGLATAGMAMVVVAQDGLLFLTSWEIMALSGFFLVGTEDQKQEALQASWIYVVATHTGTLCLFAMFALLHRASGSLALVPLGPEVASTPVGKAIFFLALAGFGLKAGLMPLHIWLPGAHAAAPSHVSALLSGVLLKTGIYGIIRLTSLFPVPPAWWGVLLLVLGSGSGILGVAFALGQHDLKRLLAYHSVENIGIIVLGAGLGLLGRAVGNPAWVALGFAGALLHVLNHGLFKSLLFYSAGSVVHATGTREMDRLGGLLKAMPRTALAFFVGAVAISGLPPFNGFVSEWLLYLGLLDTLGARAWSWTAFAIPALALIGALALACFVKAFGTVFLGQARSAHAVGRHESSPLLIAPMAVNATLCLAIGLAPAVMTPMLERAVAAAAPELAASPPSLSSLVSLGWLSATGACLALLLVAGAAYLARQTRFATTGVGTWDCGYAFPAPSMQYTSSSMAQWIVGFFDWALLPRTEAPQLDRPFAGPARFSSEVPDTVLDRLVLPASRTVRWLASWARFLQNGRIQIYLLYVAAVLVVLLLWA